MREHSWYERIIFSIIVTLALSTYSRVFLAGRTQIAIMEVLCGPGTIQIFVGVLGLTILFPINSWLIVQIIGYVCINRWKHRLQNADTTQPDGAVEVTAPPSHL